MLIVSNKTHEILDYIEDFYTKNNQSYKIIPYTKPSFFQKIFGKKTICDEKEDKILSFEAINCADIYFIFGKIDKDLKDFLRNSDKKIFTTSIKSAKTLQEKYKCQNVDVVYPFVKVDKEYKKQTDNFIISTCIYDLKKDNLKRFLSILDDVENKEFKVYIYSTNKQDILENIKDSNLNIEVFEDKEFVLQNSNIYINLSDSKTFDTDAIKAMYYKSIVFVNENNGISELLDYFAVIEDITKPTITYKIDATINGVKVDDILEENYNLAKKIEINFNNFLNSILK